MLSIGPVVLWCFEQSHLGIEMRLAHGYARRTIFLHIFIPPLIPSISAEPSEELQVGTWRTGFNEIVNLIRLARVFALSRREQIDLGSSWLKRTQVPTNPK